MSRAVCSKFKGRQLHKICILTFCWISESNSVMMLPSTQETANKKINIIHIQAATSLWWTKPKTNQNFSFQSNLMSWIYHQTSKTSQWPTSECSNSQDFINHSPPSTTGTFMLQLEYTTTSLCKQSEGKEWSHLGQQLTTLPFQRYQKHYNQPDVQW